MPNSHDFLSAFGLINGAQFDGYILAHAASTHESVKQYQEYRYNITLVFRNTGTGTAEKLSAAVNSAISQQHIVYGIRNPYRCVIDHPRNISIATGTITYDLVGHAYRVYK